MALALGKVHNGDCIKLMRRINSATVDLAFADPPFNIGYDYDAYDDRQSYDDYLNWSRDWMSEVYRVLKPWGTFWLAIGDDYAAELKMIAQRDLGLSCRSWVIWYYTFGVNCTRKFSRSHTHLFHFVRDPKNFTFNADDPAVRVPSARQLVYADTRANSKGRLPDDTWILRPQDAPNSFNPADDTWYYARVAGTFKEREGFHGCQMPEQLLGRIIRVSSNPGEVVLDPFSGSGTSLVVAKKLGRSNFIGCELSPDYAKQARLRISAANVGDPLEGPADPLTSAPRTPSGKGKGHNKKSRGSSKKASKENARVNARNQRTIDDIGDESLQTEDSIRAITEAYVSTRNGHSTDRVLADPELNNAFLDSCRRLGAVGQPVEWNRILLRLRKSKRLPRIDTPRKTLLSRDQMDLFRSGSEIALQIISEREQATLDDILCSPELAKEFDKIARAFAPGYTNFNYRWAALCIRKNKANWKKAGSFLASEDIPPFSRPSSFAKLNRKKTDGVRGLYLLRNESGDGIYLGESINMWRRLEYQREILTTSSWKRLSITTVKLLSAGDYDIFGLKAMLLGRNATKLNYHQLATKLEATTAA